MEKRNIINSIAIGEQPKWTWLREKLTGDDVPCSWSIALFYLLSFIFYL